jgi:lipoprotein-anchoring transpeptidase ErfK/SrfK
MRGTGILFMTAFAAFCAVCCNGAALPAPAARLNRTCQGQGYAPGYVLALQICLDRRGYSCNTIDGQCGPRTKVALATWCAVNGRPYLRGLEEKAWEMYFPDETDLFRTVAVKHEDHAALVRIPAVPADKARLSAMGYESILEMFAERGHCSVTLLKRLNPELAWPNPPPGAQVVLPLVSCGRVSSRWPYGRADVVRISLSRLEITVFDAAGKLIGLFPCSIAADKNKLPPPGEIHVTTLVRDPNYTYTADYIGKGGRIARYIYPPGPNNPVGFAWIGLTLPTYGIHGTPRPERIGRAESHGCFRLANWNAVKLHSMCSVGTSIVIEK